MSKCHAIEHLGVLHSLKPYSWPAGDHRRKYKFAGYADGVFWRFFRTVREWEDAAKYSYKTPIRGPFAEATERACLWSEFEGRRILDRLGN